jgi:hypothetical protein
VTPLEEIAPEFVRMAHGIVWATVATVGPDGRPRSRVLHPIWEWDGTELVGWIATSPTPLKTAHLSAHPQVAISYWTATHDTCSADCTVEWVFDDEGRTRVWKLFENGPEPVGYDPAIIEPWRDGPTSPAFAAWRLTPYRLRVMPGTVMTQGDRDRLMTWSG